MKTIKLIFLLSCLFFYANASPIFYGGSECFTMEITDALSPPGQTCFEISVTFEQGMEQGQGVIIYDGFHMPVTLYASGSFTWCYETGNESLHSEEIICKTLKGACIQLDGCIVIVD